MDLALGLIETRGLVGAIEAADAMVKAAEVKIISKEKVTGALMIIKVMGETAAVKSSVDAGAAAAQRVGELISAHVIPRPDNQIDSLLFDPSIKGSKSKPKPKVEVKARKTSTTTVESKPSVKEEVKSESVKAEVPKKKTEIKQTVVTETKVERTEKQKVPPMDQLEVLNVHSLRRIARSFDDFPIKGRDISKANRAKLLDLFKSMQ